MTKKQEHAANEARYAPQSEGVGAPEQALLSPRRAFVVQFRVETEAARGHFTGRVEHIASGRAAHFHSPEELWAFFTRILADVHE